MLLINSVALTNVGNYSFKFQWCSYYSAINFTLALARGIGKKAGITFYIIIIKHGLGFVKFITKLC